MKTSSLMRFIAILACISIAGAAMGDAYQKKQSAASLSIEGTYKLVSRKLADGTMLNGQQVVGLMTFTKTYRNFNVCWKDSSGKYFSLSIASAYKLTGSQYTETPLMSVMDDQLSGKGTTTTMGGESKTAAVTSNGGRIEFKMPFDPVTAVFEGGKFIANNEGVFTDTWEKVK